MVGADGIDRFALCAHFMGYEPPTSTLGATTAARFENLVGTPGFEPGASALSEPRSNQLSYVPRFSKYKAALLVQIEAIIT
jgi:hypothetical protein